VAGHVGRQSRARISADAALHVVPFVHLCAPAGLISAFRGDDYDFSRFVDFYAGDMHTGCADGFDRPRHVLLPECGWRAAHGSYRETLLWGVNGLSVSHLSLAPPTPADPRSGSTWVPEQCLTAKHRGPANPDPTFAGVANPHLLCGAYLRSEDDSSGHKNLSLAK
jgi:hypothetical protein